MYQVLFGLEFIYQRSVEALAYIITASSFVNTKTTAKVKQSVTANAALFADTVAALSGTAIQRVRLDGLFCHHLNY